MRLSAKEMSNKAEGNVKAKTISKTKGIISTYLYDKPLMGYLHENEQPEYVFKNGGKGFRIISEDGTERTPHHNATEGDRYILFTDKRVIYVAGVKGGDEYATFPYEAFLRAEILYKMSILLHGRNGTKYKFAPQTFGPDLNDAVDYVNNKISSLEYTKDATLPDDLAISIDTNFTIENEEIKRVCRECKSEVAKDVERCPHCGWKPKKRGGLWWGTTAVMSFNPVGWAMGAKGASDAQRASKGVWEESEIEEGIEDRDRPDDPIEALERLKELFESGVITEDEFEAKKKELLDQI